MAHYESPLAVAVKGGIAGLVGTAALTLAMQRAPALLEQVGMAPHAPGGKAPGEAAAAAPQKLAEKVAVGVAETPISPETKQTAGETIHWAYGALWGVFYGIMQSSLRLPDLVHGTIFGGLVATVASTLVPALRLSAPPTEQPVSMSAFMMSMHLLYGVTTALTFRLLSRDH